MSNTNTLYGAMKRYTDTMLAARAEYLETLEKYKTARGSQYFDEVKEAAMQCAQVARTLGRTLNAARQAKRAAKGKNDDTLKRIERA